MGKLNIIRYIVIGVVFAVGAGGYIMTKVNDGPVEQAAEAILRTQGIDIDFSKENEAPLKGK
jgi:hypothetical protein